MSDLLAQEGRAALAAALAPLARARGLAIVDATRLSGGAIQQNLALEVAVDGGPYAGRQRWVLRTDAPSQVAASRSRLDEYALLTVAHAAGVATPVPLFARAGDSALPPFFVMTRMPGDAAGFRLVKDGAVADRAGLVRDIGRNLARIHAIAVDDPRLACLGPLPQDPTRDMLAGYRAAVAHWRALAGDPRPVLDWTLAWLEQRRPAPEPAVLLHRDYRIGNLLVDAGRVTATLDWEFAGFGDPREDLGWFTAPCWRFGRRDRGAGGIADTRDFVDAYNAARGSAYADTDLRWWQVLAQVRWAVIALQQVERVLAGGEASLELALTGRLLPELEWQMLELTEADDGR
ncbi:MAG: phosphotransferase family protein [Proteobacteria bacterium]|nr:phosphotransferase family protein [Pseudomonadota bacterium]